MKPASQLKQAIISRLIAFLDYNRFSVNNFKGTSREITSLYEYRSQDLPSSELMRLVSEVYAQYNPFCERYIPPTLFNSSNTVAEYSGWSADPLMLQGNHYALLPLIACLTSSTKIVEIGTFRGASARAFLDNCNISSLTTFDIEPWHSFYPTFLSKDDFVSHPLSQVLCNLSDAEVFSSHCNVFLEADLVFLDAPKNYFFEKKFLSLLFNLYRNNPANSLVLLIDDVNLSTMTRIWRSIEFPKIKFDLIGHWSGTGMVLVGK